MSEEKKQEWRDKAYRCSKGVNVGHDWVVTAWQKTPGSQHATMMMCGRCFHHINITEVYANRETD